MPETRLAGTERRALSLEEFAVAFGLSRRFVERQIRSGGIESIKLGGRRLIPMRVVNALLSEPAA